MDLVAALQWVKNNIAAFGGDPSKVMTFGQSGGGWKMSCLLASPAATGLYRCAAIQSGSLLKITEAEEGASVARMLLRALELDVSDGRRLQDLPWATILQAAIKVGIQLFVPVLNDDFLPRHPFHPDAPAESANIPLMISSTLDDAAYFCPNLDLTEAEMRAMLSQFGDDAPGIADLYREHFPKKSPYLLLGQIIADAGFRRFAHGTGREEICCWGRAAVCLPVGLGFAGQ